MDAREGMRSTGTSRSHCELDEGVPLASPPASDVELSSCVGSCEDEHPCSLLVVPHHVGAVQTDNGERDLQRLHPSENGESSDDDDLESDDGAKSMGGWIVSSNASFFLGSILYLLISVWDLLYYASPSDDNGNSQDENDDDDSGDDEFKLRWWIEILTSYSFLSCAAAFMYVANAAIDFGMSRMEIDGNLGSGRFGDDPRWELGVAVTFGLAASFDLLGAVLDNEEEDPSLSYVASSAAVHIYLVNAILVITGRRVHFSSWPKAFTGAGDILFLMGSVIDVVISYFDSPEMSDEAGKTLAWWGLASSALWFIDSLLYIAADLVPTKYSEAEMDSDSEDGMDGDEQSVALTPVPYERQKSH